MILLRHTPSNGPEAARALQAAQMAHWDAAIDRLGRLDELASVKGWRSLEQQTGVLIRSTLQQSVRALANKSNVIRAEMQRRPIREVAATIQELRGDYLRTETMVDFYVDAVNSRSSQETAALLSALDELATGSMKRFLGPLGHATPPAITYLDRGLGASILKAGLRLWDQRSLSPACAIKVVRHNILTPTALFHEIAHQIAHMSGWNDELAKALNDNLPENIGPVWASWASEVGADAIGFVFTGFAAVSALRNVVDGGRAQVFRYFPGDPHPIGFIRVLLGVEMAKRAFGQDGIWAELGAYWERLYPIRAIDPAIMALLDESRSHLPRIVEIVNYTPYASFRGRSLSQHISPSAVSPQALDRLEEQAGPQAFSTPSLVRGEGARLIALSGLRMAQTPTRASDYYEKQRTALRTLGAQVQAA